MDRTVYDQLIEITARRRIIFTGAGARAQAQEEINRQRNLWIDFLNTINNKVVAREVGALNGYFLKNTDFQSVYRIEEEADQVVLTGHAPILSELNEEQKNHIRRYSSEALACFLYEWYVYLNANTQIHLSPKLNAEFFEYAFYKNSGALLSEADRNILDQALSDAAHVTERRVSFDNELRDFFQSKRNEIEAFVSTIKDDKRFQVLENVWVTKKLTHSFVSALLFLAIVAAIGGAIGAIIWYKAEILTLLTSTNITQEKQYIAVILLLVPVLAAAWFLRLLMRLQNNYSNLAQDAKLREALIKTYLRLASGEVQFGDQERLLMLNAIFRPLPGGQEEILPPSLADLIKPKG